MPGKTFTQAEDFSALFGPPTDARVWRYMSLGALLNILVRGQLFFSRADKFNDLFEGVTPRSLNPGSDMELQRKSFISCWSMSEDESFSMWQVYGRSIEAVAIQSTHTRLVTSLDAGITPAPVIYLDRDQDQIDVAAWPYNFFQKDRKFQDEKEFRLFIAEPTKQYQYERFGYEFVRDDSEEVVGMYVRVNLPLLIERIVVAPCAAQWLITTLQTLVHEGCGLQIPIEMSALSGRVRC